MTTKTDKSAPRPLDPDDPLYPFVDPDDFDPPAGSHGRAHPDPFDVREDPDPHATIEPNAADPTASADFDASDPDPDAPDPDPESRTPDPDSPDPDPGPWIPDSELPDPELPDDPITRLFETRSSLLEKIPALQRRKLNRAIIDRDPPTYTAVYKRFDLRSFGVSFTSFFRYAHRLRLHASAFTLPEALPDGLPNPLGSIVTMLTNRIIDALTDPDPSFNTIHRIMNTLRMAARLHAERDQLDATLKRHCDSVSDRSNAMLLDLARHMQAALGPDPHEPPVAPPDPPRQP